MTTSLAHTSSAVSRRTIATVAASTGLLCTIAGAGCAQDPSSAERLVSWRLQPAEGESRPLVLGIYDRELSTPCRFRTTSDGSLRCLPTPPHALPTLSLYADAACEHMLITWVADGIGVPNPTTPPELVAVPTGPRCAPVYVPRRTERLPAGSLVHTRGADGACTAYSAPVSASTLAGKSWLVAGDVVPDAMFAEGRRTRVAPPPGQRLGSELVESADGGPFLVGVHDVRWQRGCSLMRGAEAGAVQCWPPVAEALWGRYYLFTDASCATRLAGFGADSDRCEDPALVRGLEGLNAIDERFREPPYSSYAAPMATCSLDPNGPRPPRTFRIGPPLEERALAELKWKARGGGPLRFLGLESDDGRAFDLPSERYGGDFGLGVALAEQPARFATATGAECLPYRIADGSIRCLPSELMPLSNLYYADERCTQPLAWCSECEGKRVLVPATSADPFGAATAVRALGPAFTAQAYTTGYSNDHLCRPVTPAQIAGGELHTLAAQLPWDGYPRLLEWPRGAVAR